MMEKGGNMNEMPCDLDEHNGTIYLDGIFILSTTCFCRFSSWTFFREEVTFARGNIGMRMIAEEPHRQFPPSLRKMSG